MRLAAKVNKKKGLPRRKSWSVEGADLIKMGESGREEGRITPRIQTQFKSSVSLLKISLIVICMFYANNRSKIIVFKKKLSGSMA